MDLFNTEQPRLFSRKKTEQISFRPEWPDYLTILEAPDEKLNRTLKLKLNSRYKRSPLQAR